MDATVSPVCGYGIHGGGGISNQKMAFLGVMLDSFETALPVVLPHFTEMDQMAQRYDAYAFGDIFDEARMADFCRRWTVRLETAAEDSTYRNGYEHYFWKTFHLFHGGMFDGRHRERDAFIADAIRSLTPHLGRSRLLQALRADLAAYGNLAVGQFRIERDWQAHAVHLRNIHSVDEDFWLGHTEIAAKIQDSLPMIEHLYVVCDEAALFHTKEEIRAECRKATGLRLLFKSDFLSGEEVRRFGPLRLSLIDFEIARGARIFVGNSHSTFSNLVTLEAYVNQGVSPDQHYVYNKKGPLYRRQDLGLKTWP